MNLQIKRAIRYQHDKASLKYACDYVNKLENRIIVIEGPVGAGKSTIIEALIEDGLNIFRGHEQTTHIGPIYFSQSDCEYVALDETEYFQHNQVLHFLKLAALEGKKALISSQGVEYFSEILQSLFREENVTVITL